MSAKKKTKLPRVRFDAFEALSLFETSEGWTRDAARVVLLHFVSEQCAPKAFTKHLRAFAEGKRIAAGIPVVQKRKPSERARAATPAPS